MLAEAARFQMLGGETDAAIRTGESALTPRGAARPRSARAEAMVTIGTAKGNSGDMSGVDDLEQALAIASGRAAWRAYNNLAAVVTHGLGDVPRAQTFLEQGLAIAEHIGDRAQIVWFRSQLVLSAYEVGTSTEPSTTLMPSSPRPRLDTPAASRRRPARTARASGSPGTTSPVRLRTPSERSQRRPRTSIR